MTSRMLPLSALLALGCAAPLFAQTTTVPEVQQKQTAPLDTQHQKDVPYGPGNPKPLYPSAPREQKEFTVRYIYDYAESTYTPAVTLPTVPRAQVDRGTPEGALIALISAIRTGDYDAWLQSYDADAQKYFTDQATALKRDNQQWVKAYAQELAGKQLVLMYRLEMIGYIVLEVKIVDPAKPNLGTPVPTVFKRVNGQWLATNDLSQSHLLGYFQQGVGGVDNRVAPVPQKNLVGPLAQEGDAQQEFIERHRVVASVTKAAR